jgi:hypothetical protein
MFGKFMKSVLFVQFMFTIIQVCGNRASKWQLDLEQCEKNRLSGAFYPNGNSSKWYIAFSVQADEFNIVSQSDIFFAPKVLIIPFIHLKLPTRYKSNGPGMLSLSNMRQAIVRSARDSYKVYKASKTRLPIDKLFKAYEDFVVKLFKAISHEDNEIIDIALSLMYHSAIVTSVRRITEGAVSDDDICQEPPNHTYGDNLFVCSQELETMMPRVSVSGRHKRRVPPSTAVIIKIIMKAISKGKKTKRPTQPKPTRQPRPRPRDRNEWSGSGSSIYKH